MVKFIEFFRSYVYSHTPIILVQFKSNIYRVCALKKSLFPFLLCNICPKILYSCQSLRIYIFFFHFAVNSWSSEDPYVVVLFCWGLMDLFSVNDTSVPVLNLLFCWYFIFLLAPPSGWKCAHEISKTTGHHQVKASQDKLFGLCLNPNSESFGPIVNFSNWGHAPQRMNPFCFTHFILITHVVNNANCA